NGFDVVNNTSGQASRQCSAVAKREHDGLADLKAVSCPGDNARISDADGDQRLRRTVSATLYPKRIRAAFILDSLAKFSLAGVKVQRDERIGHRATVAGAL